jgi:hypothetical protein
MLSIHIVRNRAIVDDPDLLRDVEVNTGKDKGGLVQDCTCKR